MIEKEKKKEIQNMLTYLLILFYTLTCYFHREKCFEFEGNVYDLFFIHVCEMVLSKTNYALLQTLQNCFKQITVKQRRNTSSK
jgi:hypothetical protein